VNCENGLQWCVLIEGADKVDHVESFKDLRTLILGKYGTFRSFESTDRAIAVDRNNQRIAKLACTAQQVQVARMNNVETTIGKDNSLSRTLQAAYVLSNGVSGLDGNHV